MNEIDLGYYYSILHLCDRVADKLERFGIDEDLWFSDEDMRDLVYTSIEQVGEKANKVRESAERDFPGIPWNQVIGLRNILVHDYDNVSPDIVWDVVSNDLPELRRALLSNKQVADFYLAEESDASVGRLEGNRVDALADAMGDYLPDPGRRRRR